MSSFSVCGMCVCGLVIYTVYISILCVSLDWTVLILLNLINRHGASAKWVIFEKQRYCWTQCKTGADYCEHITVGVNVYLWVSRHWFQCVQCVYFLCMISDQSASKSHVIFVKPTANLTPCWTKHIASCFCYEGTKAQQV